MEEGRKGVTAADEQQPATLLGLVFLFFIFLFRIRHMYFDLAVDTNLETTLRLGKEYMGGERCRVSEEKGFKREERVIEEWKGREGQWKG